MIITSLDDTEIIEDNKGIRLGLQLETMLVKDYLDYGLIIDESIYKFENEDLIDSEGVCESDDAVSIDDESDNEFESDSNEVDVPNISGDEESQQSISGKDENNLLARVSSPRHLDFAKQSTMQPGMPDEQSSSFEEPQAKRVRIYKNTK